MAQAKASASPVAAMIVARRTCSGYPPWYATTALNPAGASPRRHAVEAAFAGRTTRGSPRLRAGVPPIRLDRRVPEGEAVRVTLQDKDGTVLSEGDAW